MTDRDSLTGGRSAFLQELAIGVVAYRRPKILAETLRRLTESVPTTVPIYVQANHTASMAVAAAFAERRPGTIAERGPRPDDSRGHLAADWNHLIDAAFRGGARWFFGIQDDLYVEPGWVDPVVQAIERDVIWIHGPGGDQAFLMHRSVWHRVGPFDERFLGTAHKEIDYILRVCLEYPYSRLVMEDIVHGFSVNPIGIDAFWKSAYSDTPEWWGGRGYGMEGSDAVFSALWPGMDRSMFSISDEEYVKSLRRVR